MHNILHISIEITQVKNTNFTRNCKNMHVGYKFPKITLPKSEDIRYQLTVTPSHHPTLLIPSDDSSF